MLYCNASEEEVRSASEGLRSPAADIAAQLTQYAIAYRIDGQMGFADYETDKPCVHDVPADPTHRRTLLAGHRSRPDRLRSLHAAVKRLKDADDLRDLFGNLLHYQDADAVSDTTSWPDSVRSLLQPGSRPEAIAHCDGFTVTYVRLAADRLHADEERRVIDRMFRDGARPGAFVFTAGCDWDIVFPVTQEESAREPVLRRLRLDAARNPHTLVERLDAVDARASAKGGLPALQNAWARAFSLEAVTEGFYEAYSRAFEAAVSSVGGIADDEHRRLFVLRLFNRLLFVAFIQHKGWMTFGGSRDYLEALWADYASGTTSTSAFYPQRLVPLFFDGLNMPRDQRTCSASAIGDVPYLNGGLFQKHPDDVLDGVVVPDEAIRNVLDLFSRYNLTVHESGPMDEEVAVDPEMLGRVFERLVVGRRAKGAYYTPRHIVSFMCREALKSHLMKTLLDERPQAIDAFVDDHDATDLAWPEGVLDELRRLRVCDPACGSGAYLLGMLHEILGLRACLFRARRLDAISVYKRKLEIIQRNVYGVDIEPFVVDVARLRLWLSLAVEFEGNDPPPLPNLDFKVECGDSLIGAVPGPVEAPDFRVEVLRQLREAKAEYLNAHGARKEKLFCDIQAMRQEIGGWPPHQPAGAAFDWAVRFDEVFDDRGGFDIVIANPPYVRAARIQGSAAALKVQYGDLYDANADLLVYFYYRGLALLKPDGVLVYISSNKWLYAGYGKKLKNHLAGKHTIESIIDFGDLPVFKDAHAYPMILLASKGGTAGAVRLTLPKRLPDSEADLRHLVMEEGLDLPAEALANGDWELAEEQTLNVKRAMEATGIPLDEFIRKHLPRDGKPPGPADIILSGIKTGCTEAFVIDAATRDALLKANPRNAELLRAFITGEDIGRWYVNTPDRWLILVPAQMEGDALRRYGAIYQHLRQHKEKLQKRTDKPGRKWFALRPCAYYPMFDKPKIVYQEISAHQPFALDDCGRYANNKVMFIPSDDRDTLLYLLGVLNSKWARTYIEVVCPRLRGARALQIPFVRRLPVPDVAPDERRTVIQVVERCIAASGSDTKSLEAELDDRIARLYGIANVAEA